MNKLNKHFLTNNKISNEIKHGSLNKREEKILQFGEGNFLRAFIEFFVDELNEKNLFNGNIVVIQPIPTGLASEINAQDGLYTVVLRGLENGSEIVQKRLITSISRAIDPFVNFDDYIKTMDNPHLRFIISNTTEAGISYIKTAKPLENATQPPASFPAKIANLLYTRYNRFDGATDKGFIFIPCELIDDNGAKLKEIVLRHATDWQLPQAFINWIKTYNYFTNTLVDRIVTGYPKDEVEYFENSLGYKDNLITTGELFHFFAIEASDETAKEINETLPFYKANLNIITTNDVKPYKLRKVRILNGAHTMSVLAAFLCGKETVGEMIEDELFKAFIKKGIYREIIPSLLGELNEEDLLHFADSVFDRFANPYIKHYLLSIALNSVSKFKARVLPSILDYYKKNKTYPKVLTLSFAALLAFYKGNNANDEAHILNFFKAEWANNNINTLVKDTLAKSDFWGQDLNEFEGFCNEITTNLQNILANGIENEIRAVIIDE